jgi:cytochrome P450/NADPH-cytochrome P450 reductase
MGTRFNSFYHEAQHPFVDAMTSILLESFARVRRPPLPKALFAKRDKAFSDDIATLEGIARDLLAERRAHPTEKKDLLNAMINNKDPTTGEGLDDKTIVRNMITFLIAGKVIPRPPALVPVR